MRELKNWRCMMEIYLITWKGSYLRDIRKSLKETIKKREQTEKALKETNEFLERVLESSKDGIIIVDVMGNIISSNTAIEKFIGLSKEEIKGKHASELVVDDEDIRKNIREKTAELFEKGFTSFGALYKASEGNVIEVECISSMIKDDKGNYTGGVSIVRDISERKKVEAQLLRADKMETIGTLAGGVAHDLNNTLGAIVGYPDLLLDDIPEDSPLRPAILSIKQSGEQAAEIVQDLLTLTRRGVIVTEIVNLNTIISQYLGTNEYYKLKEFNPNIVIETDLDPEMLNIMGSPIHLSKTVMNLLSNAAEAMPDGGKIKISTENMYIDSPIKGYETVKEGDYAVMRISDNGIGIPKENLVKIFEPFYTKKVMGRSGTGLGMAVVWGTVKDHNGYIVTDSTEGKGTTFKLYFPIKREEIQEPERVVSDEEYTGNGEKILVVDDVATQREIATKLLEKLNYKVETMASGEEAVEYMKNNTADLLLLDMIMDPGIDGLDTYKAIIKTHPEQKAVIASGSSETARVREARRLGTGAYIRKPYTLKKIGLAIKTELKKTPV
jgi:PAS domain S-box-containing protein